MKIRQPLIEYVLGLGSFQAWFYLILMKILCVKHCHYSHFKMKKWRLREMTCPRSPNQERVKLSESRFPPQSNIPYFLGQREQAKGKGRLLGKSHSSEINTSSQLWVKGQRVQWKWPQSFSQVQSHLHRLIDPPHTEYMRPIPNPGKLSVYKVLTLCCFQFSWKKNKLILVFHD